LILAICSYPIVICGLGFFVIQFSNGTSRTEGDSEYRKALDLWSSDGNLVRSGTVRDNLHAEFQWFGRYRHTSATRVA